MVMMLKSSVLFTNEKMPSLIATKGAISSSGMLGRRKEKQFVSIPDWDLDRKILPWAEVKAENKRTVPWLFSSSGLWCVCVCVYKGRWIHTLCSADALGATVVDGNFNNEIRPIKARALLCVCVCWEMLQWRRSRSDVTPDHLQLLLI